MVGGDLLAHAAHLYGAFSTSSGNLAEVLDALARGVSAAGSSGLDGRGPVPLFLVSVLAELLTHPDPGVVLRAMVGMNHLLRLDAGVANLRAAWAEARGIKAEIALPQTEACPAPPAVPLVSPAALLKAFAGFLNSRSAGVQLGSLACMAAVLLTPPEDPRAAKLFGSGTLSKTFQLCVDVLQRSGPSQGVQSSSLDGVCTDLLTDLLTHNSRIAASLLTYPPFETVLRIIAQQPQTPYHQLRLLRCVVCASAGADGAAAVRGLAHSPDLAASVLRQLVAGGVAVEGEAAVAEWQAGVALLLAIHQSSIEASPVADFVSHTAETVDCISPISSSSSPSALLLLIELVQRDKGLLNSARQRLPPDLLAPRRRSSVGGGGRRGWHAEAEVLRCSLARSLGVEASAEGQLEELLGSCLCAAQRTSSDVLRHHHCRLLWAVLSQLSSQCATEAQQQILVNRIASTLKRLHKSNEQSGGPDFGRPSHATAAVAMETDDEASQDPNRHPQTEQLKRRIRQLEEENAQRLLRLNQMMAEYKALEATLVEIREWSQRSIMFDRDKMDELSALRDFQAKHLSCEALTDMRVKDLSDALEHKTKKLEDTYMKLILLTKAHQKALGACEQQQRRNDDLQAELQRLSQVWKTKEDQQEQVLRDLRTTFATATQERITHSASASETVKALEVQVGSLTAENTSLKERLHSLKAQLQSTKAQGRQQELQIKQQEHQLGQAAAEAGRLQDTVRRQEQELAKQLDVNERLKEQHQQALAKLQESDGRCRDHHAEAEALKAELARVRGQLRDLDSRLQRYSSVTSLIHSLAKDPENATQTNCG